MRTLPSVEKNDHTNVQFLNGNHHLQYDFQRVVEKIKSMSGSNQRSVALIKSIGFMQIPGYNNNNHAAQVGNFDREC